MSVYLTLLVATAMVGLFVQRLARAWRTHNWDQFRLEMVALVAFAGFLHWLFGFPFATHETPKGPGEDFTIVAVLLVCMLLGMLAQVFYQHFDQPRRVRLRKKIDWGQFWAPVCASPIVFIPLMVTLQNANIDLKTMTTPKMMIFFVAFQNGFFWKALFDGKRKEIETVP
jgi:hypothetical protein